MSALEEAIELRAAVLLQSGNSRAAVVAALAEEFPHVAGRAEAVLARLLQDDEAPGSVGPYRLVRALGHGGQGSVFLARGSDGDEVAIKLAELEPGSEDDRRFDHEATLLQRLRPDPHVVRFRDAGRAGRTRYVVTDVAPGASLDAIVRRDPDAPLEPAAVRRRVAALARVARALHRLHRARVFHRDVKPANLVVDEATWHVTLVDLGIARSDASDPDLTRTGDVLGTRAFMSPQALGGEDRDDPAYATRDIYAFGLTLYFLVSGGRSPFSASSAAGQLRERRRGARPARVLREIRARVASPVLAADLAAVVLQSIDPHPQRRYADAAELAVDLERIAAGDRARARPATWWVRTARWCRHEWRAVAAMLVLVGMTVAIASLWLDSERQRRLADVSHEAAMAVAEEGTFELYYAARDAFGTREVRTPLLQSIERLLAVLDPGRTPRRHGRLVVLRDVLVAELLFDSGRNDAAAERLAVALASVEARLAADDADRDLRRDRLVVASELANVQLLRGRSAIAADLLQRAAADADRLAAGDPRRGRTDRARLGLRLGEVASDRSAAEAESHFLRALAILAPEGAAPADVAERTLWVETSLALCGEWLRRDRTDAAADRLGLLRDPLDAIALAAPSPKVARMDLLWHLHRSRVERARGHQAAALRFAKAATARLAAALQDGRATAEELRLSCVASLEVVTALGEHPPIVELRAAFDRAIDVGRRLAAALGGESWNHRWLARVLAHAAERIGPVDPSFAREALWEAVRAHDRAYAGSDPSSADVDAAIGCGDALARVAMATGGLEAWLAGLGEPRFRSDAPLTPEIEAAVLDGFAAAAAEAGGPVPAVAELRASVMLRRVVLAAAGGGEALRRLVETRADWLSRSDGDPFAVRLQDLADLDTEVEAACARGVLHGAEEVYARLAMARVANHFGDRALVARHAAGCLRAGEGAFAPAPDSGPQLELVMLHLNAARFAVDTGDFALAQRRLGEVDRRLADFAGRFPVAFDRDREALQAFRSQLDADLDREGRGSGTRSDSGRPTDLGAR